ncbi:MAG: efflux RND transporter periplasmic adaptor subunit [Myxococcota bacterium]
MVAAEVGALPVHLATLESSGFDDTLTLLGRVEAKERMRVTAEAPGRIEALPFAEGEPVKQGQTLARINARMAEAQAKQAEAQLALAKATLTRTKALAEKQLAAQAELDMAEAQAAQAEAAHELTLANLEKAVIHAAISGVATNVVAQKGEVANPGVMLLEVVQLDQVKVIVDVPERDVPMLTKGGAVALEVEAFPERKFTGTLTQVALVANGATRTFPAEILVDNKDGALRPGMLARVQLTRQQLQGVVVVPRDAVLDEADGKAVYVAEAGVAQRRVVELGATRGRFTVVTAGLKTGEQLIVLGHRQAVEGQRVQVTKSFACCRNAVTEGATSSETATDTASVPSGDTSAGKEG